MSRARWIVSTFIAWHLLSIVISSLPSDAWIDRTEPPTLFPSLARTADALGAALSPMVAAVRRASTWAVGNPAAWYIEMTGMGQNWAMFSEPPKDDRYWRVRYYVEPTAGRSWTATELIGPSHREDRIRLLQSYRDSYRDKAFEIAFAAFVKRRKPSAIRPDTRPDELPDDLAPIGRFFARRFAATLPPGERIVRTEIWVGIVGNKPPGRPMDASGDAERRAALLGYTEGPVEDRLMVRPIPPYHGVEQEGDIRWLLEYYESS